MKLSTFNLSVSTLAGFLLLASCEDVPAPYEISTETTESDVLLSETFSTSMGDFQTIQAVGNYAWSVSYSCAQVTSYVNSANNDAESWLITPPIDAVGIESAYVSFDYILRYALASTMKENHQVLVSNNFSGIASEVNDANWTALSFKPVSGSDWNTWYSSGKLNIPAEMLGSTNLRVALRYKATTEKAGTWEVKNLIVSKGMGGEEGPDEPADDQERTLPYNETFASSLGGFSTQNVVGSYSWINDYSCAQVTAYVNSTNNDAESWLVSPAIKGGASKAHVSFEYILRYALESTVDANHRVLVSSDYDGDVTKATWTDLSVKLTQGSDWKKWYTVDVDLPASVLSANTFRVALCYKATAEKAGTWEVRNFAVAEGEASSGGGSGDEPGGGGGEVTPSGDNLVGNGDFETWSGSTPANWTTSTSAGNATLSQSSDAHSGSFSVQVGGASSANKRLGYKETTLKAGTYNVKFYAKAATSTGGSVRPGYVPVTDGKVGSYVYGDYVNDLNTSTWVEVNYSFTLASETTVSLVIMNSKNPGADVLIDDYSLTTSDGGLVDGGSGSSGDDPSAGSDPSGLSWDFKSNGQGSWTVNDVKLSDLTYVWSYDSKYGMKASAFKSSTNYEAESWLISPVLDLSSLSAATLSFSHAGNYFGDGLANYCSVWASSDGGSTWTQLTVSEWPTGWTFVAATCDLAAFAGKNNVKIAFKYTSTSETAPTWEIDKAEVK